MNFTQSKDQLILETFPVGSLGCNTSVLYNKETGEAIIIDPGNDASFLLNFLKQKNLRPKMLLHTHAHFDHIGGSGDISLQHQCPLWLHQGDEFLYKALPQQGLFFGERVPPPLPLENFLVDSQTFGLSGFPGLKDQGIKDFLSTLHTPGHTPGSCSFYTEYFDRPLLFSGDTLFQGSIGRTDLPGGDPHLITKSIRQRIYQLPEETFCIPGHGLGTSIDHEKKTNPYVRGL